jgi:hypothetical protein
MKHAAGLVLATGLGLMAVALTATGLATTLAAGPVDLVLDMRAPAHVAPDSTFVVNIAYANVGTGDAPDVRVTATLPDGVQFVTATDRLGAPLPPGSINDNVLEWNVGPLPAHSCCGHILITEKASSSLIEGTALTNTASITTTAVESNTVNNTASAVSIVCEMAGSVKQVHAGEVMPGDVLTYTIVISRARRSSGPMDSAPLYVRLTDTLPFSHQVRFLGWTSDVTGTHEGQMLRWQGQVRAGEPLTLQYRLGVDGVITPGAVLTNIAHLGWTMGHMQLGPVTTVVTLPHYARMIGPNGDEWRHAHGVTLTVPPGAVTETTRFQFQPLFTGTQPVPGPQPVAGPPGMLFAHRAFELTAFRWGEGVHQFGQPLTITVHFSDTDVTGLKRETLRLWYRNGPGEPWATLGEPARVMSGALAFTTTHLSQFALFAEGKHRTYLPVVIR